MIEVTEHQIAHWLLENTGVVVSEENQAILQQLVSQFTPLFIAAQNRLQERMDQQKANPLTAYIPPLLDDARQKWLVESLIPAFHARGEIVIRKAYWPGAKQWALAFTHDVDMVRAHSFAHVARHTPSRLFSYLRTGTHPQDPYWNFEEVLEWYEQQSVQASFYFLARAKEKRHFRYRLASQPFKTLLQRIHAAGHEIGLHSSLTVFQHPRHLVKEKKRLETLCPNPIYGMRQHYLKLTFPEAWQEIARSQFEYDSSVGFNNALGFAMGTCFPFRPLAPDTPLVELPLAIMDYPMMALDTPPHFPHASRLIGDVQRLQGALTILIHPHHWTETHFFPYKEFLFMLVKESAAWQATLHQITIWWQLRAQLHLRLIRKGLHRYLLQLTTEHPITNMGLEIYLPTGFRLEAGNFKMVPLDPQHWRLQLPPLAPGTLQLPLEVVKR